MIVLRRVYRKRLEEENEARKHAQDEVSAFKEQLAQQKSYTRRLEIELEKLEQQLAQERSKKKEHEQMLDMYNEDEELWKFGLGPIVRAVCRDCMASTCMTDTRMDRQL